MIKMRRVNYADKYIVIDHGTVIIKTQLAEITIAVGSGGPTEGTRLDSIEIRRHPTTTVSEPYRQDDCRTLTRITGPPMKEK